MPRARTTKLAEHGEENKKGIRRIPSSTYRLLLNKEFTFRDAKAVVGYLDRLGIGDCYSSPILKARVRSMHGYDVVDLHKLNPEIGSRAAFDSFVRELKRHRMGFLLDIVPNHMNASADNSMWMDVLKHGPSSRWAAFFDIRWSSSERDKGKVVLPVLLDEYDRALRSGKLRIKFAPRSGTFLLSAYEATLPLSPASYASILRQASSSSLTGTPLPEALARGIEHLVEGFGKTKETGGPGVEREPSAAAVSRALERRLARLARTRGGAHAIDQAVERINGRHDLLGPILEEQFYRLMHWRRAATEINYRRFLSINDLVAIRVELPSVFEESHDLVMGFIADGEVNGLRIDHLDGLWDPPQYLRRLQAASRRAMARGSGPALPRAPLYVVPEKILKRGETLRREWPVQGTTGYDFANLVNGLFLLPESSGALESAYREFTGSRLSFHDVEHEAKKLAIRSSMSAELRTLAALLRDVAASAAGFGGLSLDDLSSALGEVAACLSVYRTYVSPRTRRLTAADSSYLRAAIEEAEARNGGPDARVWRLLRLVLLNPPRDDLRLDFVMRFQQFTVPVMVMGVEDTAFYRYNKLVSLNEVGGDPGTFGVSVEDFHRENLARVRRWPHGMLASSTHDTKRSEDVRARINVLSELPQEWRSAVGRWRALNRRNKTLAGGKLAPDENEEYLLYQTLIGSWPFGGPDAGYVERMVSYALKASKESKAHTSWVDPDIEYDAATEKFVRGVLARDVENPFLAEFLGLQRKVAFYGMLNSLSQLLLKLTCPGVPDVYQGTEIWDFSLVDPDNRRRVDFPKRMAMLDRLAELESRDGSASLASGLLAHPEDGSVKMFVLNHALLYRRAHAGLFDEGGYIPLDCLGARRDHVCAFMRENDGESVVVVVPRFFAKLTGGREGQFGKAEWGDTRVVLKKTGSRYRNVFTDEQVSPQTIGPSACLVLDEVFRTFPVALLHEVKRS
jgi:(1->4)-alpha-D-glucan 1-alpha-D-glucosylmutase